MLRSLFHNFTADDAERVSSYTYQQSKEVIDRSMLRVVRAICCVLQNELCERRDADSVARNRLHARVYSLSKSTRKRGRGEFRKQ